jgi:RNA polymerase sigma factor (sigma-70 family)
MATAQLGTVVRHIRNLAAGPVTSEPTDGALLRAFLACNDQVAFEALMRRHGAMVLRVCRRVLGDVHNAEDAFQATFLTLAQQAHSIRKKESLASWLHGVAYRMATHAHRAAVRRRRHESQADMGQAPPDPALSAAWREIQVLLDEEIERLPETLRAAFVPCCLENKSCAEVAKYLRLEESTVRKRLSRARKLLQERLNRRGVSLTAVLAGFAVGANGASAALPRSLVRPTVAAAAQLVTGHAPVRGLVSAQVLTLMEGVKRTMFLSKCKTAILLLSCAAALGAGLGLASLGRAWAEPSKEPPPTAKKASADASTTAQAVVKVRGRVLGPDGKPIAGAKLYLGGHATLKTPAYPVRATSGEDGNFAFTFARSELDKTGRSGLYIASTDSTYQVLAVAKGHGCAWVTADATARQDLTLRLVQDAPVSGRILDQEGKPVAGARLTVTGVCDANSGKDPPPFAMLIGIGSFSGAFGLGWVGPLPGQPTVLTTGADGKFRLAGVGRDRAVAFRLEGRGIATEAVTARGNSFECRADVSRPIRGVVRDKATGKPLAGATLVWRHTYDRRYEVMSWRYRMAITDKGGHYELLGVPKASGSYGPGYLAVRPAEGQLYFQQTVVLKDTPGLEPMTVDIDLLQGGVTVRGKVTDKETGKPIAGALVEYFPLFANPYAGKMPSSSLRSEAITGADGSYTLTALPGQGMIGVVVTDPDAYAPAYVAPKEIKAFFKHPLIGLNGDSGDMKWAAGGNSFDPLPLGQHGIGLLEPGETDKELVKDVSLEPTQQRKGRVLGPDGQPLTGVTVRGLSSTWWVSETLKGAEFTVRGINPRAPRALTFHHKGKNLGLLLKELPNEKSGPLTVRLQPCGSISGRLLDPDGGPLAGGQVNVMPDGMNGLWLVTADKEGRFRAEGLIPGWKYHVSRRHVPGVKYGMEGPPLASVVVEGGKNKDVGDRKIGN